MPKYKRFARVSVSDDTGLKYKNSGDKIKCFGCQSKINFGIGYFRCRNRECDYDVCNRCALCSGVDDASEGEEDDSDFEFIDAENAGAALAREISTEPDVIGMKQSKGDGPAEAILDRELTPLSFANKWLDR